jgi:acyl-CoA synthetase (AMP-forming)/AMP-acid ligase II
MIDLSESLHADFVSPDGTRVDCKEFLSMVAVKADQLESLKLSGSFPNNRVAILGQNTVSFISTVLACWVNNLAVCAVNGGATDGELQNICSFMQVDCILGKTGFELDIPSICLDEKSYQTIEIQVRKLFITTGSDSDALVLFTSGSTGAPKAVVISFRALFSRVAVNIREIPPMEMEKTLVVLPMHFGHGLIGNVLTPLFAGSKLLVLTAGGISVAAKLGELIDSFQVTFLTSVPSFWNFVLAHSSSPKRGTVRRVHIGSAPLSFELWKKISKWVATSNVWNMYGITETSNWVGGIDLNSVKQDTDSMIGKNWSGDYAVLVGEDISPSGVGELLLTTPGLMSRYHSNPEQTECSFINGWYRTGDIADIKEGVARLVGRLKLEINRGGVKISPEELETLAVSHPLIADACVIAPTDATLGERVVLLVAPSNIDCSESQLQAWMAERISADKVPDRVIKLESIIYTSRGKLDRRANYEQYEELQ